MKKRLIAISLLSLWLIGIFANVAAAAKITYEWTLSGGDLSATEITGNGSVTATLTASGTGTYESSSGNPSGSQSYTFPDPVVTPPTGGSGVTAELSNKTSNTITAPTSGSKTKTASNTATLTITASNATAGNYTVAVGSVSYTVKVKSASSGGGSEGEEGPTEAKPKFDSDSAKTAETALKGLAYDTPLEESIYIYFTSNPAQSSATITGLPHGMEYKVYKDTDSELPEGIELEENQGVFEISGTPRVAVKDKSKITLSVKNSKGETKLTPEIAVTTDKFDWVKGEVDSETGAYEAETALNADFKVKGKLSEKYVAAETEEEEGGDGARPRTAAKPAQAIRAKGEGDDDYRTARIESYANISKLGGDGDYVVLTASPAPVKFTVKNLPDGLTASADSLYGNLVIYGTFKTASTLASDGTNSKPLTISAQNANTSAKATDWKFDGLRVLDEPKFKNTKTALTAMTTDKAYKQKIEYTGYADKMKVYVAQEPITVDSGSGEVTTEAAVDIANSTVDPEAEEGTKSNQDLGYAFAVVDETAETQEEPGVATEGYTGTAGVLKWNATSKQLEGTLTKVPGTIAEDGTFTGGKIYVVVQISNPVTGTRDSTSGEVTRKYLTQKYEIAVSGIAPTVANEGSLTLTPVAGENDTYTGNTIKFKASKGTYPITLKAYIDAASAKAFGLGTAKIELSDVANGNLGITFTAPETTGEGGDIALPKKAKATPAQAKRAREGEITSVKLSDANDYAVLTIDPSAIGVATEEGADAPTAYEAYKNLPITIEATNVATGTKAVTKQFKISLNPNEKVTLSGPVVAETATETLAVGDMDTTSDPAEITKAMTYNAYMKASDSDATAVTGTFTFSGKGPLTLTAPKKAETQNGITATPGTDETTGNPTVTFSGAPIAKKDAKFTITATNPYTKATMSQKITFAVQYPKGLATEKPVIDAPSDTIFDDSVTEATINISKGLPLTGAVIADGEATTSALGAGGLKVYIDKSAAKSFFGATSEIDLNLETAEPNSGLRAVFDDTTGAITLTYTEANAKYQAWKQLPITVEAYNYVTGEKSPVKKTFKFSAYPDEEIVWDTGADTEAITAEQKYSATVGTNIVNSAILNGSEAAITTAPVYRMTGKSLVTLTSPKLTDNKNTVNGITAAWDEAAGTVTFTGTPTKKGAAKFVFTAENKNTKKKGTLKVTFNATEAAAAGGVELDKLSIKVAEGETLDWTLSNIGTKFEMTGVTQDTTITAELDKATAKIFGGEDKITLFSNKTTEFGTGGGDETTKLGIAASNQDTSGWTGVKDQKQVADFGLDGDNTAANLSATVFKGGKLTISLERPNGTKTDKASKSFTFSMNKDATPVWTVDDGNDAPGAEAAKTITIETSDATTIDKMGSNAEAGTSESPLKAGVKIEEVTDLNGETTVAKALTFTMDLLKPYKITPYNAGEITMDGKTADGKNTNGLTVTVAAATSAAAETGEGLPAQAKRNAADPTAGYERVTVTITGTPTAGKDTTSKIPLEVSYPGNGKKSKITVIVSAFADAKIAGTKDGALSGVKEVEAGKKFSIKPKATASKKLTPKWYTDEEGKGILDASLLTLNTATGEISGSAPLPTLAQKGDTFEYDDSQTIDLYVFTDGNYPAGDVVADDEIEKAADTAKVAIKIKPVAPKIKTSKIEWYLGADEYATDGTPAKTQADSNAKQLIEVSNITAAQLVGATSGTGDDAVTLNPMASLSFKFEDSDTSGFEIAQTTDESGATPYPTGTVTNDGSAKAMKGKAYKVTVSNYGVSATKAVSFTVYDAAPAFTDGGDTASAPTDLGSIEITGDWTKTVTQTLDVELAQGWTDKSTSLKWAVTKLDGATVKIAPNSKEPMKATLTVTSKKKTAEKSGNVTITVTNSATKEVAYGTVAISISAAEEPTDEALPEKDSAKPEEAEPEEVKAEETVATPDEKAEATEEKEDRLLGEGDVHIGHERTTDSMRDTERQALSKAGYAVAAILPEISVTADGQYDLVVSIDEKVAAGRELVWFAFPRDVEASEDDEIVDFYEITGKDTTVVPENHELIVSPWFEKDITYAPVIAVKAEAGDQATDEKGLKDATEAEDKEVAKVEVLESGDEAPEEESEEVKMDLAAE